MDGIRKAGDVVGTPGWQLDQMMDAETERFLKRNFEADDDDFPASNVASDLASATYNTGRALDFLCRAFETAEKYGKEKELDGFIRRLEDLESDIYRYKHKLEGWQ